MKSWSMMVILLFALWLMVNGSLAPQVIASGAVVAVVIATVTGRRRGVFRDVAFGPRAIVAMALYPFVFLGALVRSNIDVAARVLSPSLPINPAIVEVKTRLASPVGRLVLANSITLTPGTLSVEIDGDSLFIHWIDATATDVEGATRKIVSQFERYLEVIFG